jgi:hypothetical protein
VRRHAIPLALLSAALILAFSDVIGPGRGLFYRDHVLVFKPEWWAVRDSLLHGALPALTRSNPGGVPLECALRATYTPLTALILIGDFDVMYDLFVVACFMVLAAGAYALAIDLGARRHEAVLSAAVMTLSGPILSLENLLLAAEGLAYAPWVLWAFRRVLVDPRAKNAALLALFLGFHAQGIMPELLLLDLAAAIAIAVHVKPKLDARLFAALGAGAVLGLSLAAISLFPALEALPASRRGQGFAYEEQSGWRLTLLGLVELFAPSFWAPRDVPFLNVPSATSASVDPPYLESLYFGSAIAIAASARGGKRTKIALAAIAFFLVVAMGKATPIHRVVATLPLLRSSRYAVKYLLVVAPLVALLSVLSLRGIEAHAKRLGAIAFLQATLIAALVFVVRSPEFSEYLSSALDGWVLTPPFSGISKASFPELAVRAMEGRLYFAAIGPMLLAIAAIASTRPRFHGLRARWLAPAITGIVLLDLALAGTKTIYGVDIRAQEPPDEARRAIESDEDFYVAWTPKGRYPAIAHTEGRTYFEDLLISYGKRNRNLYRGVRRFLDFDVNAQSNATHAQLFTLAGRAGDGDFIALMSRIGASRITTWSPNVPLDIALHYDVPGEDSEYIYKVPRPASYARGFVSWRAVDKSRIKGSEIVEHMTDPRARDVALVFDAPDLGTRTASACAGRLEVELEPHQGPTPLFVDVRSACEALIVIREVKMEGWTARIDDLVTPLPLYEAEAGFIAALSPPGKHRLAFEYHPKLDRWKWVSLFAFAAIALLAAADRLAERRR